MERNHTYYIGLDDTDYGDSIGTGALSRELAEYLKRELNATCQGITRHQFLIHPDIPYTTHNSGACIALTTDKSLDFVAEICEHFMLFLFHPGADPGLCVMARDHQHPDLVHFGHQAQTTVVSLEQARQLGQTHNMFLKELGGDGIGIIGALASSALRIDGNDGRFIGLRGIRGVPKETTALHILETTGVETIVDEKEIPIPETSKIQTNNWVRPLLVENKAVLRVFDNHPQEGYFVKKEKKVYVPRT